MKTALLRVDGYFCCCFQFLLFLPYCVQNASGFYAEIDGAKKELQEKLANLSQFDDNLVQRAMDYAQELQELANELDW